MERRGDRLVLEFLERIDRKLDTIIEEVSDVADTESQIQAVVASLGAALDQLRTDVDAFIARQSPDVQNDFAPVLASITALDAAVQAAGQTTTPTATTTAAPVP